MIRYAIQELKDVTTDKSWLHLSENEVYRSFKFPKRKKDWLLGRWTAKTLLTRDLFQVENWNDIEIRSGNNRAPYVFLCGEPIPFTLSISHSNEYAFCAVSSTEKRMGCDIEKIEKRSINFEKDYFLEKEHMLAEKMSEPGMDKDIAFSLFWSAKESLMKALKTGLKLHPAKIEIEGIKITNERWNTLQIRNLKDDQLFYGKWMISNAMIYTIVCDAENFVVKDLSPAIENRKEDQNS